jgi:ketosteroid isomerase-like protein
MSQETTELAEKAYEAFNRRDPDALADLCDPAVVFNSLIAEEEGELFEGREGIRAFFQRQDEAFDRISVEIEDLIDYGNFVIVHAFFRAHGRESGVPVEMHGWQTVRVSANRVMWWRFFRTQTEALEAAGLRE